MDKIIKLKITELNQVFNLTIFSSNQFSISNFPSYIELSCATSIETYDKRKSDIKLCLKNKPKYRCSLNDRNKLPIIFNYFTNKKIVSLNMDYIENNICLLSFMLSPYKESVFFNDIGHGNGSNCDFSMALTSPLTDEICLSLFLCKYTLYIYNMLHWTQYTPTASDII